MLLTLACLTLPACLPACPLAVQRASAGTRQTLLERQDVSRMYLAHHELESVVIISTLSAVTKGWW